MPRLLVLTAAMLATFVGTGAAQLRITHKWVKEGRAGRTQQGARALGSPTPQLRDTVAALAKQVDNQEKSLETATWRLFAFTGAGNTMRNGPHNDAMKAQLLVLLPRATPKPTSPPPKLLPLTRAARVLANLAVLRSHIEANYKLLVRYVDWGMPYVLEDFVGEDKAPPTATETVYLALFADALLVSGRWPEEGQKILTLAREGAARLKPGTDRFHDAIRHFVALVAQEKEIDPELTTALCWPADPLKAPLHAWLGAYTLRFMPPNVRAAQWPYIERLLQKREKDHLWPAATGLDRKRTAAMMTAIVGMSYGKSGAEPYGWTPPAKDKDDSAWR